MSIIPSSYLSASDLALLGNNLGPPARKCRREAQAVNRSLAKLDEGVSRLFRRRDVVPSTRRKLVAA